MKEEKKKTHRWTNQISSYNSSQLQQHKNTLHHWNDTVGITSRLPHSDQDQIPLVLSVISCVLNIFPVFFWHTTNVYSATTFQREIYHLTIPSKSQ